MPTPTYTPLATVTLGSSASSVTFSSIPATYRDLILVIDGIGTGRSFLRARFNGDTGTNYSDVFMVGDGANRYANAETLSYSKLSNFAPINTTRGYLSITQIMDYSATDKHKTALLRGNSPAEAVESAALRWANTSAITTILIFLNSGQFAAGSRFDLYGIAS
jgi:hypothetical protein